MAASSSVHDSGGIGGDRYGNIQPLRILSEREDNSDICEEVSASASASASSFSAAATSSATASSGNGSVGSSVLRAVIEAAASTGLLSVPVSAPTEQKQNPESAAVTAVHGRTNTTAKNMTGAEVNAGGTTSFAAAVKSGGEKEREREREKGGADGRGDSVSADSDSTESDENTAPLLSSAPTKFDPSKVQYSIMQHCVTYPYSVTSMDASSLFL